MKEWAEQVLKPPPPWFQHHVLKDAEKTEGYPEASKKQNKIVINGKESKIYEEELKTLSLFSLEKGLKGRVGNGEGGHCKLVIAAFQIFESVVLPCPREQGKRQ